MKRKLLMAIAAAAAVLTVSPALAQSRHGGGHGGRGGGHSGVSINLGGGYGGGHRAPVYRGRSYAPPAYYDPYYNDPYYYDQRPNYRPRSYYNNDRHHRRGRNSHRRSH